MRDFKREARAAFFSVLDTVNQIRSTIGQSKAIDYSDSQTGHAQYKNDISFLKVIDYAIDVENAANGTLESGDLVLWRTHYLDQPDKREYSTEAMMKLQEKLGKVFIIRGLYPTSKYFTTLKQ